MFHGHSLSTAILAKNLLAQLICFPRFAGCNSSSKLILYGYYFAMIIKNLPYYRPLKRHILWHCSSKWQKILAIGLSFNHINCDFFNSFFRNPFSTSYRYQTLLSILYKFRNQFFKSMLRHRPFSQIFQALILTQCSREVTAVLINQLVQCSSLFLY